MSARYDDILADLRAAYDGAAQRRDQMTKTGWKLAERAAFADRLRSAGCRTLLEVGAAAGRTAGTSPTRA